MPGTRPTSASPGSSPSTWARRVNFSCHGTGTVLDIYRIGYYAGLGWRKVTTLTNTATSQPDPTTVADTNGATTCTAWSTTASWAVPSDTTSGLFVGVYRNLAGNNASYIPFVVRNDDLVADIIVKTSDTTWALAYNFYGTPAAPMGGSSLYGSNGALSGTGGPDNRVHYATYHRPIVTREGVSQTYWLNAEAPLIRFLERNGYNVKYVSSQGPGRGPFDPGQRQDVHLLGPRRVLVRRDAEHRQGVPGHRRALPVHVRERGLLAGPLRRRPQRDVLLQGHPARPRRPRRGRAPGSGLLDRNLEGHPLGRNGSRRTC